MQLMGYCDYSMGVYICPARLSACKLASLSLLPGMFLTSEEPSVYSVAKWAKVD